VTDFCIHCRASLAPKAPRRRWRATPEQAATPEVDAPPTPAVEHTPYVSYEPPPQTFPAASAPAPAPAAVAVLERDPVEFPGQPLPDDFFGALPERARRAPRKLNRKLVVLAVVVVSAGVSAVGGWADRNDAVSSPARHLVAGACAEYRDINNRLNRNPDDFVAGSEALAWFQSNGDRFAAAAQLDPGLQGAADYVVWFNEVVNESVPTADEITDEEFAAREQPLTDACYTGPGRA
jgi:hypothetical protein